MMCDGRNMRQRRHLVGCLAASDDEGVVVRVITFLAPTLLSHSTDDDDSARDDALRKKSVCPQNPTNPI